MFNINGIQIEELVERDYRNQLYLGEEIIVSGLTSDILRNYSGILYSFCYNYRVSLVDCEQGIIEALTGIIPSFNIIEPTVLDEALEAVCTVVKKVVLQFNNVTTSIITEVNNGIYSISGRFAPQDTEEKTSRYLRFYCGYLI